MQFRADFFSLFSFQRVFGKVEWNAVWYFLMGVSVYVCFGDFFFSLPNNPLLNGELPKFTPLGKRRF